MISIKRLLMDSKPAPGVLLFFLYTLFLKKSFEFVWSKLRIKKLFFLCVFFFVWKTMSCRRHLTAMKS